MNEINDSKIVRKLNNSSVPFVALLIFFVGLGMFVVWPLMPALAWACVLSFFSYPVYKFIAARIFRGRRLYIAAGINTALILFVIVLPVVGAGITITREVGRVYAFFMEWLPVARGMSLRDLLAVPQLDWFFSRFPDALNLPIWNELMSNVPGLLATFMTRMSRELVGNAFKLVYNLVVITVASFFITHDGHKLLQFISDILPLSQGSKDTFFLRAKQMLYAIFYGVMLTAGIQGILGGLGWWFVGLANPVLFGGLMFFFAMLPFVGTPMVWVPGVIYLFLHGDYKGGLILLFWGLLVVSTIDNLLRPFFISEGSKAHILLVFAGILGGLSVWGFLGLFLGPLVLSVAYFMLQLYRVIVQMPEEELRLDLPPRGAGQRGAGE